MLGIPALPSLFMIARSPSLPFPISTRREYIKNNGAIEAIVFAMQKFTGDADVLSQGCQALSCLTFRDIDATLKVEELGLRAVLEEAAYELSGDEMLMVQVEDLLQTLPPKQAEKPTASFAKKAVVPGFR